MMRILAFAALVGAVEAGLTSGGKCGAATTGDSDLCTFDAISTKVAEEVDDLAVGRICTATTCPCWGCYTGNGKQTMTADSGKSGQVLIAADLTVMKSDAMSACSSPCFGAAADGPIAISTKGFSFPDAGVTLGDPNWCGMWAARQTTETCSESIFDAKGLLFLVIIGGALAIIFFQCSIMAVVAALSSGDDDDAKP